MMTTTTTKKMLGIRTTTSVQGPAIMYVHFDTIPRHAADAFPVLVVPHHLRSWCDVRRNATH